MAAAPVFSQSSISDLTAGVNSFSGKMAQSLPFYSTIGLNWSDAYIGQLISAPPHFGFGLTAGAVIVDAGAMRPLMSSLGYSGFGNIPMGLPLPAYTAEVRLGGIILPFDAGLKFGYLDTSKIDFINSALGGMSIDYLLVGADIRYAVLDSKVLPIKLSVGFGVNYLKGGVSTTLPTGPYNFSFGGNTLNATSPNVGLRWETTTFELKTQVSFPLFIITPYVGAGVSYSMSKAGYEVKSNITVNGGPISQTHINQLHSLGVTGVNANGFESMINSSDWNMRLYGGLSFNLAVIKIDITGMYNLFDSAYGGTVGVRFQL